jgi:uncharacterized protein
VQIKRFENPAEFYTQVEPFLMRHEAQHCLLLGVCTTLIKTDTYLHPPYLAYVEDAGEVVAVALRTPPHSLALSQMADLASLQPLANDLHSVYPELYAVDGPKEVSKAFVETWKQVNGQNYRLEVEERVYRLEKVHPVNGVGGEYILPTEANRELLVQWLMDFSSEAVNAISREEAERNIDLRLTSEPSLRGVRLWCDEGKPVSFAGYGGLTPNGIRIGPVYTPPEYRGHGYASACVAALTQELLDQGRKFCFLFTDLSNPTSNHIYQEIGYQPISDFDRYAFEVKS